MCRYCRNLKLVKELQIKELFSAVNYWKRRDLAARKLLQRCSDMIFDCSICSYDDFGRCGFVHDVRLYDDIQRFLK